MRKKAVGQQNAQPVKQAPAPVNANKRQTAPNSAVLDMMRQNMSAEDAIMTGIDSLPSTPVAPTRELSDKILGRLGISADSMKIYKDEGLSELGQSAYARGNEIHVSGELYAPETSFGEHLIMHEAAHVLQNGLGRVSGGGFLDNSGLESQAEALSTGGIENAGIDVSGFSAPTDANAPMMGWNPFKSISNYFKRKKREKNDPTEKVNPTIETEDGNEVRLNELIFRLRSSDAFQSDMQRFGPNAGYDPFQSREGLPLWSFQNAPDRGNTYEYNEPAARVQNALLAAKVGGGVAGNLDKGATAIDKASGILGVNGLGKVSSALNAAAPIGKAVGSGLGLVAGAGNTINRLRDSAHAHKVGNKNEQTASGLFAGSALAGTLNAGVSLGSSIAGLAGATAPAALGSAVVPGLGIASGAFQAASGAVRLAGAIKSTNRMNELYSKNNFLNYNDSLTAKQFNRRAKRDKIEAGWDIGTGAVTAAGSVASFFTAGIGSAVSAVGGIVGAIGKTIHSKIAKKTAMNETLNEAVALDWHVNETAKQYNIDKETAEKVVLRAMGCKTTSREELFQRVTLNRAIDLQQRARSGDEQALAMLDASGLSTVRPEDGAQIAQNGRNYSLQGIAERLGMDKNSDVAKQWAMARTKTAIPGLPQSAAPQAVPNQLSALALEPRRRSASISMPSNTGANRALRRPAEI